MGIIRVHHIHEIRMINVNDVSDSEAGTGYTLDTSLAARPIKIKKSMGVKTVSTIHRHATMPNRLAVSMESKETIRDSILHMITENRNVENVLSLDSDAAFLLPRAPWPG